MSSSDQDSVRSSAPQSQSSLSTVPSQDSVASSASTLIQLAQSTQQSTQDSATQSSSLWASSTPALAQTLGVHPLDPDLNTPLSSPPSSAPRTSRSQATVRSTTALADPSPDRVQHTASLVRGGQKGGRHLGPIWQHFVARDERDHPAVECIHCHRILNSAAPKRNMVPHALNDCTGILPMDKQYLRGAYNVPLPSERPATNEQDGGGAGEGDHAGANTPHFGQLEFEMLVARVFFCCALPFVLVDDSMFRLLFATVAPQFRLPSRAKLSGELLVKVKEEYKAEVIQTLNRQGNVSIVTDGWTDVNGSSIVNFMVVAPGMKSIFWSSLATGTEQHTAQFMAAQLQRVIAEIHRETRALVVGVLTDNAPNMASAWELLENKLPVFGGGCAAHVLNLLMEDIFKKILFMKKIKDDALSIVHFVREHHALLDKFRHLQRTQIPPDQARHALVIPVATRWYTAHACLRSVLHNRAILEDLFQSSRHAHLMERYKAPATVRSKLLFVKELIGSDFFWQNLAFAVAMVDPVIEALRELESDGVPTSRVYERFKWLRQGYSATLNGGALFGELVGASQDANDIDFSRMSRNTRRRVRAEFYGFVDERWKLVHTNAIGIAYLLDPNTDPDGFIGSDEADSISQACAFAVRTGMLDRLEITRAQLNGWLYAFASEKRGYTEKEKEEILLRRTLAHSLATGGRVMRSKQMQKMATKL